MLDDGRVIAGAWPCPSCGRTRKVQSIDVIDPSRSDPAGASQGGPVLAPVLTTHCTCISSAEVLTEAGPASWAISASIPPAASRG